jgi:hypothetical protein
MEYVPVSFNPNPYGLGVIAINNELGANAITEARYLKDPARRSPNQKTAFARLTFRTAEIANKVLREGLIIEGKKVFGRKDIPKARRCLKCQGFGNRHIAANCQQIHDTCAVCGGMHRTPECPASNTRRYCVNCRQEGHTASSHNCQVFIAECKKIKLHFPENKYRFYPIINDPTTWQLIASSQDTAVTITQPPPAMNHTNNTRPVNPTPSWNGGPRQPRAHDNRQRNQTHTLRERDQGRPRNRSQQTQQPNTGGIQLGNPNNSQETQGTLHNWLSGQQNTLSFFQEF